MPTSGKRRRNEDLLQDTIESHASPPQEVATRSSEESDGLLRVDNPGAFNERWRRLLSRLAFLLVFLAPSFRKKMKINTIHNKLTIETQ